MTSDSANAAPADRKFYGSILIIEAESLDTLWRAMLTTRMAWYVLDLSDRLDLFLHGQWDKEKLQILPTRPLPAVSFE